jgi:preprotein translocase subunit SecG
LIYVLYTIHVLVSIFLILVVLLQRGKGADLSVFGGGATQAAFGARGQASLLHKLTVICFVAFILTTLSIGLFEARSRPSVMGEVEGAPAEEEQPPAPAQPGGAPVSGAEQPGIEAAPEAGSTGESGASESPEAASPEAQPAATAAEPVTPPESGAGSGR